jgi:hypothetical protein
VGDYFLFGLLAAFGIYEAVMHFAFRNEVGNETLSALIQRLQRNRWWVRVIVASGLVALFLHLVIELY